MLPGRRYTPAAIGWILRTRRWLLMGTLLVFMATAIWLALALPDRYRAQTTILVVPQRVPENYVRPVITESIEQRLFSISPQILSETRLERIILELDLYPKLRQQKGGLEDVIESMRKDISVEIIKGDLFRVTYAGDSPYKVMQVTQRLASLFVEENLKDREQQAVGTNEFLESQLLQTKQRLEERERMLQEYRQRHAGELPSQVGANLQVLQNASLQLQSVEESLARDRDRRLELEHALMEVEMPPAKPARRTRPTRSPRPAAAAEAPPEDQAAGPAPSVPGAGMTALVQLMTARQQLQTAQLVYTADHPDVIRLKSLIARLETSVAEEVARNTGRDVSSDPATAARMTRASQLRQQIAALDGEIGRKAGEVVRLKEVIATYQQRVETQPALESELIALTRDYEALRASHASLQAKREEASIAANLEKQQVSQQFRTLDPARLPEQPYAPNRRLITIVGAGARRRPGPGDDHPAGAARPDLPVRTRDRTDACAAGHRDGAGHGDALRAAPQHAASRDVGRSAAHGRAGRRRPLRYRVSVLVGTADVRALLRADRSTVRPDAGPALPVLHAEAPGGAEQPAARHQAAQGCHAGHRRRRHGQDDAHPGRDRGLR